MRVFFLISTLLLFSTLTFAKTEFDKNLLEGKWEIIPNDSIVISLETIEPNKYKITKDMLIQALKQNLSDGLLDDALTNTIVLYTDLETAMASDDPNAWFYMGGKQMASMKFKGNRPEKSLIIDNVDSNYLIFKFPFETENILEEDLYNKDPEYANSIIKNIIITVKYKKVKQ